MSYDAYPDDNDLGEFLAGLGATVPDALDLFAKAEAAWKTWEDETAYHPWLAKPNPLTLRFDPPGVVTASGRLGSWRGGRHLELSIGLIECWSINIGVVDNPLGEPTNGPNLSTPLTINSGTPLQRNLQYFLLPDEAPVMGDVYDEIEFATRMSGIPKSIAITGIWGRERKLSANVWQAILQYGAFLCVPELSFGISGGLSDVQDERSKVTFVSGNNSPLSQQSAQWEPTFYTLAHKKKRI